MYWAKIDAFRIGDSFALFLYQFDSNQQTQRYCIKVTALAKVTLRDGVYHEDVGFGMLDNCRQKGMAIDPVRIFPSTIPCSDTNEPG